MTDKPQDLFDSDALFNEAESNSTAKGPVTCLGKTFANDDERRAFFREELRSKLPELKKIEGFPIGEDDDIINLSDPPYYTACPNPWLDDFVKEWEEEKKTLEAKKLRKATFEVHAPYATDVSEGKYDPLYKLHPYHTKVPHIAIMKYLLYYTQPGDIVFDGFCGTGMTGVACNQCGTDDIILRNKIENEFSQLGLAKPQWGARKPILCDLSPIASFIAYDYNFPVKNQDLQNDFQKVIDIARKECSYLYATQHTNGENGKIISIYWSDVFICNHCASKVIFWDSAVDKERGVVLDTFKCPKCHTVLTKEGIEFDYLTKFDSILQKPVKQVNRIPVLINYEYNGKVYTKKPDEFDLKSNSQIEELIVEDWVPMNRMCPGSEARRNDKTGITHVHQFYFKRNLIVLANVYKNCTQPYLLQFITSVAFRITKRYSLTYQAGMWGAGGGPTSGTLYIPSLIKDLNILDSIQKVFTRRLKISTEKSNLSPVSTQSSTTIKIASNSIDYIFLDPPFGSNLNYSELSFIWESWLKVFTNIKEEAIENKAQHKNTSEYKILLKKCLIEAYRILKPGKWLTMEFSNTKAAIWNAVQTAISEAGFIIANVSALDKQKGTFVSTTTPTAVKQDLVISCYKPSSEFDEKFKVQSTDVNIWTFIEEHLDHLPVSIIKDKTTTAVIERSPKILYDRMLTFFLMRNLRIPLDAGEFQDGLRNRFKTEDGMVFTTTQLAEYQAQKKKLGIETNQLKLAFDIIYTENDAVQWIKEKLETEHLKYNELMPAFRKANTATRKGEKEFELKTILEENFIEIVDGRWRNPDPNELKDREILRTKALLKEFDHYLTELGSGKVKKLKDVRLEALRAGFKNSWEKKDWGVIVNIADKIPQNLLMEDEQLLMYYDIAKDRM